MADGIKLDGLSLGLAFGIIWGVGAFLLGLGAWLLNWGTPVVELISSVYIGYSASLVGSLLGLVWGFADAFIGGVLIAWLYNLILEKRTAKPVEEEKPAAEKEKET